MMERLRPWPVYLLALAAPVSIAAVSTFKTLTVLAALGWLVAGWLRGPSVRPGGQVDGLAPRVVLLMLAALGLSTLWSVASLQESLGALSKYGKLLLIPCVLVLLRSADEARRAVALGLASQTVILLLSVALGLGLMPGWPFTEPGDGAAAVTSSYLDQSIMTACFMALCWHLRELRTTPGWRIIGAVLAVLALANVLLQHDGRSGYLAVLAMVALAAWWAFPRRWRVVALLVPVALGLLALAASPRTLDRVRLAVQELRQPAAHDLASNSIGLRLHFWGGAVHEIAKRPVLGAGAGAWATLYRDFNDGRDTQFSGTGGNPHQEFLLWGIHLGLPGLLLYAGLLLGLARDAGRLRSEPVRRAVLSITLILALSSLFNSALYDGFLGDYFCVVLGLLLALGWRTQPSTAAPTTRDTPA